MLGLVNSAHLGALWDEAFVSSAKLKTTILAFQESSGQMGQRSAGNKEAVGWSRCLLKLNCFLQM